MQAWWWSHVSAGIVSSESVAYRSQVALDMVRSLVLFLSSFPPCAEGGRCDWCSSWEWELVAEWPQLQKVNFGRNQNIHSIMLSSVYDIVLAIRWAVLWSGKDITPPAALLWNLSCCWSLKKRSINLKIKCGCCGILQFNTSVDDLEERVKLLLARSAGDTKSKGLVSIE